MIKRHTLIAFVVLLMFSAPVFGADYQKAHDAIKKQDYELALRELTPLAEKGDPKAQSRLGWLYQFGLGTKKDPQKAIKWYRMAAEQGNDEAQYELGEAYSWGEERGVPLDYSRDWFLKAANQGNLNAQHRACDASRCGRPYWLGQDATSNRLIGLETVVLKGAATSASGLGCVITSSVIFFKLRAPTFSCKMLI